ncbi:MAG: hypothetical protein QMC83_06720 [Thermodesulfovibrionales bacterium]|nr:hypothetical protein [Thermodesulfovibrionales bacterium]
MQRMALLPFFVVLSLICFVTPFTTEGAGPRCVDSEGEAVIVNNDIPSAKTEAIARAKWSAIEQTVGVEVKAQSIVQNMALVDDAVSKQIRGIVTGYKTLQEKNKGETFWVRINACVEPSKAREAVSSLALNNSIAVFIPARKPKVVSEAEEIYKSPHGRAERHRLATKDEYEETNILSETLIGRLTEQGYIVIDVAPTHAVDAQEIENAIKSGNFLTLRSLMYKFLSNILLISKIDYTISTRKGEDIGYGISMPFNNVTVRLTYRIVTRDSSGKMVILTAGVEEGKGLAMNVEDATAKGMKELAEKLTPVILDKMGKYIQGIAKKVQVKVDGITDINTNFEVKEALQNIAWVTNVEEKGLGEFVVSYPENTVYLANSISQKGNFQVVNFLYYLITVKYQR